MGYLSEDESNTDWIEALQNDASHFELVINRVEALGTLAAEKIKRHDLGGAMQKIAEMMEGIKICKSLLGLK